MSERKFNITRSRSSVREGLCCCEYENKDGRHSHVMAMLCDCEAVDSCCDFLLRCQPVPETKLVQAIETVEDRCRIPAPQGALKISLEALLPSCSLLLSLCVSSSGPYYTFFSLSSFFVFIFFLARVFSFRRRSRIYVHTTYASISILFFVFITIVIGFRKILLWEILTLSTLAYFTVTSIKKAQRDPGCLKPDNVKQYLPSHHSIISFSSLDERNITWLDSRPIMDNKLQLQCQECELTKPYRSAHCRRCAICVLDRDHHCVWLDTCIGRHNHLAFFKCLLISIVTLSYGIHLTWTTLCTPEIYLDWFLIPADCRFIYNDFPSGLSVACASYACILLFLLLLLFAQQCLLIGQNVTGQEFHKAKLSGKTKWFGLVATGNMNNRGVVRNFWDFFKRRRSLDKAEPLCA